MKVDLYDANNVFMVTVEMPRLDPMPKILNWHGIYFSYQPAPGGVWRYMESRMFVVV